VVIIVVEKEDIGNAIDMSDQDEYLQTLIQRYAVERKAMVGTIAAITKRMVQIYTRMTGEEIRFPQSLVRSITEGLEIELSMRVMDEIDPNWVSRAVELMANDSSLGLSAELMAEMQEVMSNLGPKHEDQAAQDGSNQILH